LNEDAEHEVRIAFAAKQITYLASGRVRENQRRWHGDIGASGAGQGFGNAHSALSLGVTWGAVKGAEEIG
jgi:hypothetical protein